MKLIKTALWNVLLLLSPRIYEHRKSRNRGVGYLPVFDATRSIFIHVPKAGGTSVAIALYGRNIPHATWHEWYDLNPKKFRDYFKFAIVRHPISRFVSAFNFLKAGGMNEQDQQFANRVLNRFADANQLAKAMMDFPLEEEILRWWHFRPQVEFVADKGGRSKMDLLIRLENIEAGFAYILRRLNYHSLGLPHLNKTRLQSNSPLDKEACQVLSAIYRRDLMLWENQAS